MAVALVKITNGNPAMDDGLPNHEVVTCPRCAQTYRLGSSDEEWHKLQHWMKLAEVAARDSHPSHEANSLPLVWKTGRRR
jgi:hypothetical protein